MKDKERVGTEMKSEAKHRQWLEAVTAKKRKEKRIRGCGWHREITSHWYRGGGWAWANWEEGAEWNLKTVKNL